MIIPSGMNAEQVIRQINKVVNRIAPKYVFYGYEVDDLKQESFIICMEALPRYDSARPLENFLSVHLSNRLKNFVRDNHFVNAEDSDKVKVMKPAQLDHEHGLVDGQQRFAIRDEQIDYRDMIKIIDRKLPAQYRMDYLKMQNDVYVSKQRREEITIVIYEILTENGYEKGPDQ
jgi:DNA-directed RNA polymerase specialized sigma subunit